MAKGDYSIDWKGGDPGAKAGSFDSQPLSAVEIARIEGSAGMALKAIAGVADTPVGYDAATVKRLSDDIERLRKTLDAAGRIKIANLYGAFLGGPFPRRSFAITCLPEVTGRPR